jgi:hypothetical protein
MARFNGRFVSADAYAKLVAGGAGKDDSTTSEFITDMPSETEVVHAIESALNIGIHILIASVVIAVVIICFVIPEYSYKQTERLRPEDLEPDRLVLVPNRLIGLNTVVRRTNRITGDRQTIKSQDAAQDDIVLAPRREVQGDFTVMTQGDAIPIHAELLDTVGWMRQQDCQRQSEQLGYLVAT